MSDFFSPQLTGTPGSKLRSAEFLKKMSDASKLTEQYFPKYMKGGPFSIGDFPNEPERHQAFRDASEQSVLSEMLGMRPSRSKTNLYMDDDRIRGYKQAAKEALDLLGNVDESKKQEIIDSLVKGIPNSWPSDR